MAYEQPEKGTLSGFLEKLYENWGEARKKKEIEWQEDLDNFLAKKETTKWKTKDAVKEKKEDQWKSDVFVRLVKQKVVMAYTHINDLILQGGQVPFMLKPNPGSYTPEQIEMADKLCEQMRDTIRTQLIECKAEREFMLSTFSMALYGECYVKSPLFHEVEKKRWKAVAPAGFEGMPEYTRYEKEVWVEQKPCISYKSVWNMFVDPEYIDIQEGRGIIERDFVTPYDLRKLKGRPGYNDEAIEKVISENLTSSMPSEDTSTKQPHLRDIPDPDRTILWIEFWGRVPTKFLKDWPEDKQQPQASAAAQHELDLEEKTGEETEVHIIKANDTIIRVMVNDTGKRPYRRCHFETILDDVHGIGTARNVVDAQQITNGAYRNVIDNIALSGNVILGTDDDALSPGQKKQLYPGKNFRFKAGTDIRKAMGSIKIQNVAGELMELLALAKQHADEESLIPRIMQGDLAPKKQPDTLGEINLLFQNAGKYFGQVAKNIDEDFLEPIIEDYYEYNMYRPDNQAIKGDFEVHALGFNSFQSKVIKMQSVKQLIALILSDPTGTLLKEAKLRPLLEEVAKALDLDPDQYLYSDKEKEEMAQMQKAAEEEQFQRQLQLARAQLTMEAEIQDEAKDQDLERDLAKEEAISKIEEEKATRDTEREIVKEAAKAKVTNLYSLAEKNKKPAAGRKPTTRKKKEAKSNAK